MDDVIDSVRAHVTQAQIEPYEDAIDGFRKFLTLARKMDTEVRSRYREWMGSTRMEKLLRCIEEFRWNLEWYISESYYETRTRHLPQIHGGVGILSFAHALQQKSGSNGDLFVKARAIRTTFLELQNAL